MNIKKIGIIGGGLSGLSTAYWLGREGFDVTVFEKNQQPGGTISTLHQDGYLIDAGPNSGLETSSVLKNLISDLELDSQKVYANEAADKRYILKKGQLTEVPMKPQKFITTRLFSTKAKLRLIREPFIRPTNGEDISLADFVRHRLGKEILDYAVNPFVAGVFAGDPEILSTEAAFPKLYQLEKKYGSFIKGTIKGARERKKRDETAKDRSKMFSFLDGMQIFTDTLAEKTKGKIRLNTEVIDISYRDHAYHVISQQNQVKSQDTFDAVILSAPTYVIGPLLSSFNRKLANNIKNVTYAKVAVVFSGFDEKTVQRKPDGFGFLIPKVENYNILGSIWSSTIFPQRAAAGKVAFTTFVGGMRQPGLVNLADDEIKKIVFQDLNKIMGLKAEPELTYIRKWEKAIPQYTMGYKNIQASFDALEDAYPGLFFAGNFRRGIGIGDSVLCARDTVEKIKTITGKL